MAQKFATLKDVATLANTTVATASFVLNGAQNRYISDDLRSRVEKAAKTLNYVKHSAASSLKGKKTGIIALLSPQYENRFFSSIFMSIERILNEQGYVLATLNTFDDPAREQYAINQMARLRVDGFLVIPTINGKENTAQIRKLGLPFVAIERPLGGVPEGSYDFISSNNLEATYTLTKNAIEKGHKKIALAYWESEISHNIINLQDRKIGYQKALKEYGLMDNECIYKGDILRADGERITQAILQDKDVTAIIYAHYILAEGGIAYLRKNAIRVPEDMSISFLGATYWADMMETDFTHVVQPGWEVGRQSVKVLLDRIEGYNGKPIVSTVPTTFHEGSSIAVL